jgi:hypothetical protein
MAQLSMFADATPPKAAPTADLDRVRRKLGALLNEARAAADGLPTQRRRLMQTLVPQMTRWLPPEEAELTKKAFGDVLAD